MFAAPEDYQAVSQDLVFSGGSSLPQCVDVEIVADDDSEELLEEILVIAEGRTGDYVGYVSVVLLTIGTNSDMAQGVHNNALLHL